LPRSKSHSQIWNKLWLVVPALAFAPALILEAKWSLLYVMVLVLGIPAALLIRDAKLWLFLICLLSAFNFTKVVGGDARPGVVDPGLVELRAIDLPILALALFAIVQNRAAGGQAVRPGPAARRALLLGGLFIAWCLAGSISATRPEVSLVQSLNYGRLGLTLVVVTACASNAERVRWGVAGLFLSLAAQSAIAIAQYLAGSSFGLYQHFEEDTAIGMLTRSGGTLNPTVLSEYIGLLAPLILAMAFVSRRPGVAGSLVALFGAASAAAFMTLSRGGLISLALTTLIVVVWISVRPEVPRSRKLVLAGSTLVLGGALAGFFATQALARAADFAAELEGAGGRLPQFKQALEMIVHNPLFGVGLGNYVETMGRYGPKLPYPVHNKFLLVTAETGVPGGLLYLSLWIFTLTVFVRRAKEGSGEGAIFFVGGAAGILGTLINMNTDVYSTGGAPELALFLLAGLGLGLAGQQNEGSPS
jgi:O-antigen ligase